MVKVILKIMTLNIFQFFNQCIGILKELLVLVVVITFITGNLKDGLTKESITASSYKVTLQLSYYGTKTRVEFNGSCLKQDSVTFNHKKVVNIYIVYEISKSININD